MPSEDVLRGTRYVGGKSGRGATGQWVAARVQQYGKWYVEPFAGMLGVLLQRKPSTIEIINDLDSNVVNWWRVVRDKPYHLQRWMQYTPDSREVFHDCKEILRSSDDAVARAGAFSYILTCSHLATGNVYSTPVPDKRGNRWNNLPEMLVPLARRLQNVKIEHKDALELIDQVKDKPKAVLYCDPPYKGTTTPGYRTEKLPKVDHKALCDLLRDCKCKAAISGLYSSDYYLPGWYEHSFNVRELGTLTTRRTEMLWTNYPPDNTLFK